MPKDLIGVIRASDKPGSHENTLENPNNFQSPGNVNETQEAKKHRRPRSAAQQGTSGSLTRILKHFALSPRLFPKATETISRILRGASPVHNEELSLTCHQNRKNTLENPSLQLEPFESSGGVGRR